MINIAVIGAGRMGQIYCHNVAKNAHCTLVYVVSRTLESASKLAHKYQAHGCTEVSVAINNEAIDAIIIASPTPTHLDIVTMAAKAGKAVFCEKPIDLDIQRVDQCLQTLAQYPIPFMVGFNRRFDPQISKLRQSRISRRRRPFAYVATDESRPVSTSSQLPTKFWGLFY